MGILDVVEVTRAELDAVTANLAVVTPTVIRQGRPLALGDLAAWMQHTSGTGSVTSGSDPLIGQYVRIATGGQAVYQAGRDLPLRLGHARAVSFMLRRNDPHLSVLDLYAGISTYDNARYLRWNKGVAGLDVGAWRRVVFVPSEYEGATGSLADPTDVRWLALRVFSGTGVDTSVDVADFRLHEPEREATISFMFDDGRDDTYSVAFPRLAARGWSGGVAVEHDRVGSVGRMTLEQLHEMYESGWDMHGHHTAQMTTITDSDQVAVHRAAKHFLAANGFVRGDRIWVWPGGSRTAATEAIALRYWQTLRRVSSFTIHGAAHIYEAVDPSVYYMTSGKTLTQVKAAVDRARMAGSSLVLVFHSLKESGLATEDWLTADFDLLVGHIALQGIEVVPPSQVWTQ